MKRRVIWILLLAVLLLAAFLRFWHLDSMPPGLYHDEAYNGLDALSLTQGKTFPQFYEGWELYAADAHADRPAQESHIPIFFEGNYGREPLHVYLMALSIYLFGVTPFAVRAVPAAAGVLAVLTTFLAARALMRKEEDNDSVYLIPLLAALTMAILYPAVHFSRFGIRAMVFVPVETMTVATFWWGVKRQEKPAGKWLLFLISGFLLGLGIYTFAASRLLPLVWILFIPLWFLLDRQAFHGYWKYVGGMAVAAVFTALPLLLFFARYPYYFVFRIAYVANKGRGAVEGRPWMTWLLNVGRVLRGLFWYGETHLRHNLPGRSYLDPIQAVLFVMGLIKSICQIVKPPIQFLLLWFAVMLLPSILSGDAPHFGRLVGAAAPAAILVAVGATWLYDFLQKAFTKRMGVRNGFVTAGVVIVLLFVGSAFWTTWDYFGRYAKHPELTKDFYLADWQLGQYAKENGENGRIYLTPTQEELATILFALEDPEMLSNYNGSEGLIPAGNPGTPSLYLVRPDDVESLENLQSYFPDGESGPKQGDFTPFSVSANDARNRLEHSADFSFADQIKLVGWTLDGDEEQLKVTLAWQAEKTMEMDYTAFVHLIDAEGQLVGQLDRQPAGYPTSDWQPQEIVVDSYIIPLSEGMTTVGELGINTGFYFLPTLEALGETAVLE